MKDLSFTAAVEGVVVDLPLSIQGEATGRVQLAQRVMTMLLSSTTDPARTYAVGLLQAIGRSNVRTAEDLENEFTLAVSTVREVIVAEQSVRTDLTDDEVLSDIVVDRIEVDGDTVSADIQIITVTGEDLKVSLVI